MINQIIKIITILFNTIFGKNEGFGRFIWMTGLVGLITGSLMIWSIWSFSGIVGEMMVKLIPWEWAKQTWLFSLIITAVGIVALYMLFRYLFLILLSPFLSYLSERIENQVKGVSSPAKFSIARSAVRSVRVNSRNLLRESVISIVLFILSFAPVLNFITIPALFFVQAYFTGFGIMDYQLERHYNFKETVSEVRKYRWAAVTLGIIFIGFMMIPVIGQIFGPYLCTVTATRFLCEKQVINLPE